MRLTITITTTPPSQKIVIPVSDVEARIIKEQQLDVAEFARRAVSNQLQQLKLLEDLISDGTVKI